MENRHQEKIETNKRTQRKRSIFRLFPIECLEDGKNIIIEETQSTYEENKLYD